MRTTKTFYAASSVYNWCMKHLARIFWIRNKPTTLKGDSELDDLASPSDIAGLADTSKSGDRTTPPISNHSSTVPELGRLAFPPEITLIIMERLTKPSQIALALTCRTMYRKYLPKSLEMTRTERETLLLWLEKDVPSLYYCHDCVELHEWEEAWALDYEGTRPWHWDLKKRCHQQPYFEGPLNRPIPYRLARLVMNRHIHGAAHGITLWMLEKRDQAEKPLKKNINKTESCLFRIVDNKLMVSKSFSTFHKNGKARGLREYLEEEGIKICEHIGHYDLYTDRRIPELQLENKALRYFAPCIQPVRSCRFCMTDYCIDISRHEKKNGWAVKITTYQLLGSIRSPNDWNWKIMLSGNSSPERNRVSQQWKYPPGIVKHLWRKAEWINEQIEGVWD